MTRRFPEWVNSQVLLKAIQMREEGTLSKQLNLWIENLLEIEKNNLKTQEIVLRILIAAIAAP